MKRILFMALIAILTAGPMMAQQTKQSKVEQTERQHPKAKATQIDQAKQYVQEFGLNDQQAASFTEMYHAYNKKLRAIKQLYRAERPAKDTELTEEQAEKRILESFKQSRAIIDIREEYYQKFRTILNAKQVNKIFEDEKMRRNAFRQQAQPDSPETKK